MTKWILPSVMALASAAWADATTPGVGASGGGAWAERCAARLEAARDEIGGGRVEVLPLELEAPGDPTARGAVDTVVLLRPGKGRSFEVKVQALPSLPREVERRWSPWQGRRGASGWALNVFRHRTGPWAQAWISLVWPTREAGESGRIELALTRAVDDCLAIKRLQ